MYFLQVIGGSDTPKVLGGHSVLRSAVRQAEDHAKKHYPGLAIKFEQTGEALWQAQQQGILYQIRFGDP